MLAANSRSGLRGCGSLLLRQHLLQPGEARQEVVAAHGQVGVGANGVEAGGGSSEGEFVGHVLAEGGVQFGFTLDGSVDSVVAAHNGVQLLGGSG